MGLPGATGAVETLDHGGVPQPAGEGFSAERVEGEIDDVASRLTTDQDHHLAAAETYFEVTVREQARPRSTLSGPAVLTRPVR
ncbi:MULTISPECIES: hypothetical protein [unclassified Streptomyces]|uniref:hypothetical protein n=1 Tax=unclassified Streptomyces TaxID=2593676 RepID=UPI00131CA445|nr:MULTISPECIES: hypothetical protein [unclassified Streptomyces]